MKLALRTVVATALSITACAAFADVSIMYADWISGLIEPGIAKFQAETGEKVKAVKLPDAGFDQRISVDLSAGTATDVIMLDSFMVSELAAASYLQALNPLLANWESFKYYRPSILNVASYNGSVYALPIVTDVRMLWYNRDLFKKAGIAMPWKPATWKDVMDTARKVKQATKCEYAFYMPAGSKQGEATTMQGFYMALLGADTAKGDRNRLRDWTAGKWIGDSPAIRATLKLYQDIYVTEKLTSQAINYSTDNSAATREAFAKDQIAILASGAWQNTCLWDCGGKNIPSQAERSARVGWAPFPGSGVAGAPATTNISGGWTMAINAKSKNQKMATKLMTTIFAKDNYAAWIQSSGQMAVRSDVTDSPAYVKNQFMAEVTKLAETTTGRDTAPGYKVVSSLIQEATNSILDGKSIDDVVAEYHDGLVAEFGKKNVITLK